MLVLPRYFAVMPVARVALGLDGGDVVPLCVGDDITEDVLRRDPAVGAASSSASPTIRN
jgi:hypothetical protein